MKSFLNFLKTTILGGLLVIVPLFLVFLVLTEAVYPSSPQLPGGDRRQAAVCLR